MGLDFAVVTAVARDDLPDGGAAAFAATIAAIRRRRPGTGVEVLIPDCKGDPDALADRSSTPGPTSSTTTSRRWPGCSGRCDRRRATPARLAVLARAKAAGLTTKSGLIVGMGETDAEVVEALADLAAVGVDIVTIGQYLRPTTHHLPIHRWVEPATFERVADRRRRPRHRPRRGVAPHPGLPPRRPGLARGHHDRRPGDPLGLSHLIVGLWRHDQVRESALVTFVDRVARTRARMGEVGVDVLLLSVGPDLPWLCGLRGHAARAPHDARRAPRGRRHPRRARGWRRRGSSNGPRCSRCARWEETDDPIAVVAGLAGVAGRRRHRRPHLGPVRARPPGVRCRDVAWRRGTEVVGPLRAVKDAAEVEALRRAAAGRRPGRRAAAGGRDPARRADRGRGVRRHRAPAPRRGPLQGELRHRRGRVQRRQSPHHEPGSRVIEAGEVVLCDFGGTMHDDDGVGYCSDITRCVWTGGDPPAEVVDVYAVLHDAQRAACAAATVGTPCEDVDAVARSRIAGGRLGRAVHPPHRARHRHRGARGPLRRRRQPHAARGRARLLGRAGDLRARRVRASGSRTSSSPPTTVPTS